MKNQHIFAASFLQSLKYHAASLEDKARYGLLSGTQRWICNFKYNISITKNLLGFIWKYFRKNHDSLKSYCWTNKMNSEIIKANSSVRDVSTNLWRLSEPSKWRWNFFLLHCYFHRNITTKINLIYISLITNRIIYNMVTDIF